MPYRNIQKQKVDSTFLFVVLKRQKIGITAMIYNTIIYFITECKKNFRKTKTATIQQQQSMNN